jgi:hypothetical protein
VVHAVKTTAVLLAFGTFAAARAEPRIEAGGYAGRTSTTIYQTLSCPSSGDRTVDCVTAAQPHTGGHGLSLGGYIRIAVSRFALVEADVMYAQKGYGGDELVRMHYLELPILLRVDPFAFTRPVRLFGYAGLAPAIDLWCHEEGTRFDNDTRQAVPFSDACGSWSFYPYAPRRFDLGGVVGGGVGVESPWGLIEFHARYVEGLIDNGAWGPGGKTVNKAVYLFAGFGR